MALNSEGHFVTSQGTVGSVKNGKFKPYSKTNPKPPLRPIRQVILDSGDPGYVNRLLVGTPSRGTVRIEWHSAVRGIIVPTNWSMVSMVQPISSFIPVRFSVADAQNIIVRECIQKDFEWLLLLEDDTIPPVDLFIKLNHYMKVEPTPVVSGLYYTKSEPSEPLIYRGRGTGAFLDFKMGTKVWADGVPTGCLLIHSAILREMWKDSPEYQINGQTTRRIFETPVKQWINPETGDVNTVTGTSDLDWCTKVMEGSYFKKAGWDAFQRKKYPFLVDTSIRCMHITPDGVQY